MSILSVMVITFLFMSELFAFLSTDLVTSVALDVNDASVVRLNFNVTFLDLHCDYVSVDVLDELGTNRQNITKNVEKWQIDEDGKKRVFAGRNKDVREVKHDVHEKTLEQMHEDGVHATVVDLTTFDDFVKTKDLAFLNFYAPWCVWCQRLHPTWESFAEDVETKKMPIAVGQVDCVANANLCQTQKIQAFPTLRWFSKGEAVLPDYKGDRTVAALTQFSSRKIDLDDKYKGWEEKAAAKGGIAAGVAAAAKPPSQGRPDHPGCQVSGYLLVNRVPGNFHIEANSVNHNLNAAMTNLSHVVNHVSFGDPSVKIPRKVSKLIDSVPPTNRQFEPMNGYSYVNKDAHRAHHHYMKIVSTHFKAGRTSAVKYQFIEQSQEVKYAEDEVPEARFSYDLSPMSVTISRSPRKSWYDFLTSCLAIVGGTFTTMSMIDGALYKMFKTKKL